MTSKKTSLADHLEKEQLIIEYQKTGNSKLKDDIIRQHWKLVEYIAYKLVYNKNELEDLVQVGVIGLLKSVDQFDADRGVRFTTFATSNIIGEIRHYLRDKSNIVKIPRRHQENYAKVNQCIKEWYQNHGKYPTVHDISDFTGLSQEEVLESMEAGQSSQVVSLDASVGNRSDDGDYSLLDSLGVKAKDENILNRESLFQSLTALNDRERQIIYLRYYESLTQAEIAERMGLSQMHISRLIQQALRNLQKVLGLEL